jgi:hypothetical protein
MPWSQVEHDDKRQHWRPQWYCQWNDGRVCKSLSQTGALVPIQMFGYWVYSVTVDVDQLEFEWQDYDRFRANSVLTLPRCCAKLSFQWPQLETLPHRNTNCKESPLMNWWLRNGPRWRIGRTLFFQSPWLASSWRNLFHPIDFSPNPDYLEMKWKGYETIFWLNP